MGTAACVVHRVRKKMSDTEKEPEKEKLAEDPACAICLNDVEPDASAIMPCMSRHRLHASCLMRNWAHGNQIGDDMKCPLCFATFRRIILERFIEDGVLNNAELTQTMVTALHEMFRDRSGPAIDNILVIAWFNFIAVVIMGYFFYSRTEG